MLLRVVECRPQHHKRKLHRLERHVRRGGRITVATRKWAALGALGLALCLGTEGTKPEIHGLTEWPTDRRRQPDHGIELAFGRADVADPRPQRLRSTGTASHRRIDERQRQPYKVANVFTPANYLTTQYCKLTHPFPAARFSTTSTICPPLASMTLSITARGTE